MCNVHSILCWRVFSIWKNNNRKKSWLLNSPLFITRLKNLLHKDIGMGMPKSIKTECVDGSTQQGRDDGVKHEENVHRPIPASFLHVTTVTLWHLRSPSVSTWQAYDWIWLSADFSVFSKIPVKRRTLSYSEAKITRLAYCTCQLWSLLTAKLDVRMFCLNYWTDWHTQWHTDQAVT